MMFSPKDQLYNEARYADLIQEAEQARRLADLRTTHPQPSWWAWLRSSLPDITSHPPTPTVDSNAELRPMQR